MNWILWWISGFLISILNFIIVGRSLKDFKNRYGHLQYLEIQITIIVSVISLFGPILLIKLFHNIYKKVRGIE